MADYEGFFVIDAKLTQDEVEKAIVGVEGVISKSEGTVGKRESWGKKNLAYEVKGKKEGFYFVVNFQAKQKAIRELEKSYRLNDSVLRHLILRRKDA
ncbi:MAG: 30S ribosomal protein S6 [Nitrospirae bacterium]|nr:30S ribosomal protein S6 [Nitrospirota bacterium]